MPSDADELKESLLSGAANPPDKNGKPASGAKAFTPTPAPAAKPRGPAMPGGFDRPQKRKLARGRTEIEARIDLHGMRQADAHAVLYDFLHRAHHGGLRHVLVITGKGGGEGVLKQAVPKWFRGAQFRPLVSAFEEAAREHGGEGALYIRLRKRKPLP